MPILAKLAAVVAAGRAGAQDGPPGQHVIGGFLLDRVYLQGAGTAVDDGVIATADVDLVAAEASSSVGDGAPPKAHLALHPVAIQLEVESRLVELGDGSGLVVRRGGDLG